MMNTHMHYEVLGWNEHSVLTCQAKIGPVGPILAKKPAKSGPPDRCNRAKIPVLQANLAIAIASYAGP